MSANYDTDDIFAETGSHGPTCSCDECQEKGAAGYWDNDDLSPHCSHCEDNPADEGPGELCAECRINAGYDQHGCRQENDDIALWSRMDRGYAKQQYFARAVTLFALAVALIAGTGIASAAEYTPTAPIGCAITHYWAEDDMSSIAVCAGGYTVHKEAGPIDDWNDIPYAIGTRVIGPDAEGNYHDWPIWD